MDGELRVGFFSKRKIYPGEEITFDYKYERYGQQAQKCYCGSSNCRGWLGGELKKDDKEQSEEEAIEKEEEEFSSSSEEQEDDVESSSSEVDDASPTTQLLLSSRAPSTASPVKEKRFSRRRLRKSPRKIKNFETDEVKDTN